MYQLLQTAVKLLGTSNHTRMSLDEGLFFKLGDLFHIALRRSEFVNQATDRWTDVSLNLDPPPSSTGWRRDRRL